MDSAWPMLLFLAGLFGFGLLILICGYQSRELERAEKPVLDPALEVPRRSFFAVISDAFVVPPAVDPALVQGVEQYLREQVELARQFVDQPSMASLSEGPIVDSRGEVATIVRIQAFLEREMMLAREFVSNPSIDRLHMHVEAVAA